MKNTKNTNCIMGELFSNTQELTSFIRTRIFDLDTHLKNLRNILLDLEECELYEWCKIVRDEIATIEDNRGKLIFK